MNLKLVSVTAQDNQSEPDPFQDLAFPSNLIVTLERPYYEAERVHFTNNVN